MDLPLYGRVLWRFKWIVLAGFVAALALSFLTLFSVSTSGGLKIHYRQPETWQGQSTLLLTQKGFTYGRSVVPVPPTSSGPSRSVVPKFADESRFYELSMLYSQLATSDAVLKLMRRTGPPVRPNTVTAAPVYSDFSNGTTLPELQISGLARTPAAALRLARRATTAFESYLDSQDAAAKIPHDQRVLVQELNAPEKALLVAKPKKTIPLLVFITIMTIAIGLAFLLENVRPRLREVAPHTQQSHASEARRSA